MNVDLSSYLAKTVTATDGTKIAGADILTHCVIVGEVARELIGRSIPSLRDKFFPTGSELVAAAHDIGKAEPNFQEKLRRAMSYTWNSLPELKFADPSREHQWGGHPGVSKLMLAETSGKHIPDIVGCHHGYASSPRQPINAVVFGGAEWQWLRLELLERLKNHFACDWPVVRDDAHTIVLAGLVCVADWIGSGNVFEYVKQLEEIADLPAVVRNAVDAAGFVKPLMRESLSFEDIFEVPPYPVQSAFIESISGPGVYVLEAPMGIGKTEAALYVAYKLFVQRKAGGIYFALPTQATANKMFDRMRTFLNRVFDPNTPFRETLLLHGSAWLYETNMGVKDSDAASWFHGKKKRLLAPFAVGTIDQALMAVMNVKHNVVRAFGLAGKVVILDEVHSYDSYTGVILDELIRRLREMGCTVIILSATLTDTRRMSLLKLKDAERPASPYPLITALPEMDSEPRELSAKIAPSPLVTAHRVTNDADAIEEVLKRVEQGQQILWIENTVSEAQKRYLELTGRAAGFSDAIEIGLLHARFMQCDRTHNENYWVGLFGKEGKEKRQEHGRILVGTQVLEQSLDIDADFLVTRLCPTDMLLQRIGRLWRNRDNDAIRHTTQAEVWILAGEYQYLLKHKPAMGSTAWVYDQYILFRALEVWDKVSTLRLPQDIRYLIEETYFERDETGTLAKLKQDMERKRDNLRREARFGLSMLGKVSDDKAETRHSEMDTHDVLLLHSFDRRDDGSLSLVFPAHGGTPAGNALILTSGLKRTNRKQWRDCAKAIAEHIVTVPASQVPDTPFPRALELLGEYVYLGSKYDEEPTLQVAMVKDSESLAGFDGGTITNAYSLYYKELVGYFAEKNNLTEKDEGDEW